MKCNDPPGGHNPLLGPPSPIHTFPGELISTSDHLLAIRIVTGTLIFCFCFSHKYK